MKFLEYRFCEAKFPSSIWNFALAEISENVIFHTTFPYTQNRKFYLLSSVMSY